jgi:hypothetical protein
MSDLLDLQSLTDNAMRDLRHAVDLEYFRRSLRSTHSPATGIRKDLHAEECARLIDALRSRNAELQEALMSVSGEWSYADPIYRFYHHSFKVYGLQGTTVSLRDLLQSLMPGRPLNPMFTRIIQLGTGHQFRREHNDDWIGHTLLITTAFFHARFFLEMAVRCTRFERIESPLDSDLAALLYLYNLR